MATRGARADGGVGGATEPGSTAGSPNEAGAAGDGAVGGGGSDAIDATGLLLHLRFDEASGSTAADTTSHHNDGALLGSTGAAWGPGKIGGALTLDGSANYVSISASASLDSIAAKDAFTVAAWVSSSNGSTGFQSILSLQLLQSNEETLGLYLNKARAVAIVNSGGGVHSCYSAGGLPLDTWQHLAGTFDGGILRTYVDGVEVCSLAPDISDIPASVNPFLVGSNMNGSNRGEFLQGSLDELVVYNRALSSAEVAALAAGGLP